MTEHQATGGPEVRVEYTERGRSWAAKVEGTHPEYRFERSFVNPDAEARPGGVDLVFRFDSEGDYEVCDVATDRRDYYRVGRDADSALTLSRVSRDEIEAEAERHSEEEAAPRRAALQAVRAGEGRAVLFLDFLEERRAPEAPSGWRLVLEPGISTLLLPEERIAYALYLPEELLSSDLAPEEKKERAVALWAEGGLREELARHETEYPNPPVRRALGFGPADRERSARRERRRGRVGVRAGSRSAGDAEKG